jgi:hypothetical protein
MMTHWWRYKVFQSRKKIPYSKVQLLLKDSKGTIVSNLPIWNLLSSTTTITFRKR